MKSLFIPLFISVLAINACEPGYFFEAEKNIPNGQWTYRDTLDFKFSVADTTVLYNLYLDFTHADSFPNQNLYVRLHTRFPDGRRLSKPISFDFFDAEGNPAGKCSGHACRAHIAIQQNAFFNQAGEYLLTLEQFTRRDSLAGLRAVGLAIEKSGKRN
jgi:gliding motility-associated lipoprotein GldH